MKIDTIIGEITRVLSLTSAWLGAWADTIPQTSLLVQELCSIGYEKHLPDPTSYPQQSLQEVLRYKMEGPACLCSDSEII